MSDDPLFMQKFGVVARAALEAQAAARAMDPGSSIPPNAREAIARIPALADQMRRNTGKVTLSALATALGRDRGTLLRWIEKNWMVDPRD